MAVMLAVMTAGASACGNRLDEGRLRADAARENGTGPGAGAQSAPGAAGAGTATTAASQPSPGDAGVTGAVGAPAAPAASAGATGGSGGATAATPGSPSPRSANAGGSAAGSTGSATASGKNSASQAPAAAPTGGGAKAGSSGAVAGPGPGGGVPGGGQAAPAPAGSCSGAKAPIVIGSVGEYSGLLGPILAPGVKSVQAWVAATNAKGGLNCHPVKFVVYDAGGDPSRNQALTQRAVEQDKVIAFVYNGAALSGQASADYLKQRHIPVVGEEGAQPWVCYSPNGFPIMSSCNEGIQGIYQVLAQVIKPGDKVAAITCNEVPFCTGYVNNADKYAKEAGFKLVYNGSVSMTQPDYTSACIQAKNAGAQALALGMVDSAANRVKRSCKSVGLDVPIISNGTAFSAATSGQGMDGAWIASGVRFTPPSHPAVAEWLATLKQYVPGTGASANGGIGWVSAKVFELAAKAMPDAPTSQAVLEGLWAIKGNDIGGMTRPLTYVKDQPAVQTPGCWFPAKMDDSKGGWTGDYRVCL
jgi:branched-chain amino acid transport system substrate-binding protein